MDATHWIPYDADHKPREGQHVLARHTGWCDRGEDHFDVCEMQDDAWIATWDGTARDVTHWMPLPAGPGVTR